MNKRWLLPVCAALAICLVVFRQKPLQKQISEEIGVDVTHAEILSEMDTHGGFHGDGVSCVVLQLDEPARDAIKAQEWKSMPMDQTTEILLYGVTQETPDGAYTYGPYLSGEDNQPLVPQIQDGYYLLLDRHSAAKPDQDPAEILQRGSQNLTVALYDDATGILYVCKLDT